MARTLAFTVLACALLANAQKIGLTPEVHPRLQTQRCFTGKGCFLQETSVVLDVTAHTIEDIHNGISCTTSSGGLNSTICPTVQVCAQNCAVEGVDYADHGVETQDDTLILHQFLQSGSQVSSVSPRVYLLDETGWDYSLVKLLNQELSFDVDVSNLPCGMNGALYLSEMDVSGGRSDLNSAGASYGTGYCDAQCPVHTWINGVANIDSNGACCNEMDIWEANAMATALTPHACNITHLYKCSGDLCGADGVCCEVGCGFNPYELGAQDFYGPNEIVDTTKPFTVVTQFLTDDNTERGILNQIRRLYVQNDKVIQNAVVQFDGEPLDSLTPSYCEATATAFENEGGLPQMGRALERGMVLVFSIWDDDSAFMNWLDAGSDGPCNSTLGNPTLIEEQDPSTAVKFSNIKWGDINSTYRTTS